MLIDAGAYITWVEENGLEMVAEFQREVGGERSATRSFETNRDSFFKIMGLSLMFLK